MNELKPVANATKVVRKAGKIAASAARRIKKTPSGKPMRLPDMPLNEKRRRSQIERIASQSLNVPEVASILSSRPATIMDRIHHRTLYGFNIGGNWYLPTFQFHGKAVLAGIDAVLPQLNPDLHPLEVINWFTNQHSDLVVHGEPVSPVSWLESGGDAHALAELAKEVGSGL